MFATSNEKKARKRVDPAIEGQNGATVRKSVRLARRRRLQTRGDRPFNILGCFALLHAIRSINSDGAALHIEPAAALKHLGIARS